jgi:putative flippase GtrA
MKKIQQLYLKYREIINYLIFGGGTTVVSLLTYALFVQGLHLSIMGSKALSWVCAVTFAFVTNKLWVFDSKAHDGKTLLREAAGFYGSRIATGLVELGGLPLLMKLGLDQALFGVDGFAANLVVTVVVIILNYILSKFLVFKKKKSE